MVQLVEIPGLIEGAHEDRGGGRALLGVLRFADGMVVCHDLSAPLSSLDVLLEELADTLPDPAPGPAELVERHRVQQAVQEALHGLPADFREALVLFYLQGLKYREIADTLCIPIGTVKSRLHNGLLRLKAVLAELRGEAVR